MSLRIEFQITGYGDLDVTIWVDQTHRTLAASYLSDAVGEFVKAVQVVTTGESRAGSVVLLREPQAAVVTFIMRSSSVEIWVDDSERQSAPVMLGAASSNELGAALRQAVDGIDRDQYREEWPYHEFPVLDS